MLFSSGMTRGQKAFRNSIIRDSGEEWVRARGVLSDFWTLKSYSRYSSKSSSESQRELPSSFKKRIEF